MCFSFYGENIVDQIVKKLYIFIYLRCKILNYYIYILVRRYEII